MFEKRIRKSSLGDYVVEFGKEIKSSKCEYKPGYYMGGFMVYQSSRYDTLAEAEKAQYRD
jgi:hypothetical protein